tara:strand:+ start:145 stop:348 length:204 start_codon:yes stop_codon:yes gene_type:complete
MVESIVRLAEFEFEPGCNDDRVVGGESTVSDETVDGGSDKVEVFTSHASIVPEGERISTPKRENLRK